MRLPGFIGGTYTGQAPTVATDRCINWLPERIIGAGAPEAEIIYVRTPGLAEFTDISNAATSGTGPGPTECLDAGYPFTVRMTDASGIITDFPDAIAVICDPCTPTLYDFTVHVVDSVSATGSADCSIQTACVPPIPS